MRLFNSPSKVYLGTRAITSIASLAFAFLYSRSLGVENRSVITFVMTANSLTWVVITSGTTLTLRKLKPTSLDAKKLNSFFSLYAIEIFVASLIFVSLISIYSQYKNPIPINLIMGVMAYFLLSGLHLLSVEVLLAFDRFKLSGLLDTTSVFLQMTIFLALERYEIFSIANALLAAFTITYAILMIFSFSYLIRRVGVKIRLCGPKYFHSLAKGHHSLGISLGIMDRIDRMIIGFMLPISSLGRYAVMSGMLSVFRFLPDSISKLVISQRLIFLKTFFAKKLQSIIFSSVFVILAALVSNWMIEVILGVEWLLPFGVTLFFIAQECLRSIFQIQANRRIVEGFGGIVHQQAVFLPVCSIIASIILVPFFGIYGVQVSISIAFLSAIYFLNKASSHG